MNEIQELQEEVREWADEVFPTRNIQSMALKLFEEISEMLRAPDDADEHADIYIMMLDLSRMYGVDVAAAVRRKIATNRLRSWEVTPIGTLHHIEPSVYAVWYDTGVRDYREGRWTPPEDPDSNEWYTSGYLNAQAENEGSDHD